MGHLKGCFTEINPIKQTLFLKYKHSTFRHEQMLFEGEKSLRLYCTILWYSSRRFGRQTVIIHSDNWPFPGDAGSKQWLCGVQYWKRSKITLSWKWSIKNMCCDLEGSVRSRQHWLRDTARKRNAFVLFSLFWESFNCYNFGTTGPIQVGFSGKCTSPNEDFNQIETENATCATSD